MVAGEQDSQLQRRLQHDTIQFGSKTVYLNPFLYWRRFDANTDRWLREPGQLPEEQILVNRRRFYPELDWESLELEEHQVREGAVEMINTSLALITTFNPELTPGQLLEVERKMAATKKKAFERWVERALRRREKLVSRDRRRFDRERWLRGWMEWLALPATRSALLPLSGMFVLAVAAGWWLGGNHSCQSPGVQPPVELPAP
ncbi:MAG: hypothetical protein ACK5W5_01125 [Cyanobacteriota bacterium]